MSGDATGQDREVKFVGVREPVGPVSVASSHAPMEGKGKGGGGKEGRAVLT